MNTEKIKRIIHNVSKQNALIILILLIIAGSIIFDRFFTVMNLTNVLRQASFIGIISLGMSFVILTGGIDLSVGSMFAMSGILISYIHDQPIWIVILVPLLAGITMGLINGLVITKLKIAPFIVTLATQIGYRGVIFLLTDGGITRKITNATLAYIGKEYVFGIMPIPAFLFILLTILCMFILRYTSLGRNIYAVGGNAEAARMMGINETRVIVIVYAICGLLSSFGGILLSARMTSGEPLSGNGYEMTAIAASVIGGILLSGGVGKIFNTFVGILLLSILNNLINMIGNVDARVQNVIMGAILLAVVMVQSSLKSRGKEATV